MKTYFVYIMANYAFGALYIGVTSNLERRVFEHKNGLVPGFTKQYGLKMLVYYEEFSDVRQVIQREKSLKRWYRNWKIDLINTYNPEWKDLAEGMSMDPRASEARPEDDRVN